MLARNEEPALGHGLPRKTHINFDANFKILWLRWFVCTAQLSCLTLCGTICALQLFDFAVCSGNGFLHPAQTDPPRNACRLERQRFYLWSTAMSLNLLESFRLVHIQDYNYLHDHCRKGHGAPYRVILCEN